MQTDISSNIQVDRSCNPWRSALKEMTILNGDQHSKKWQSWMEISTQRNDNLEWRSELKEMTILNGDQHSKKWQSWMEIRTQRNDNLEWSSALKEMIILRKWLNLMQTW